MYVFCPKSWLYLKHSFVQIGRNSFRRSLEQGYEDLLRTQGVVSAEALKCYIQRQDNRTQTLLQIREKELEASKNKTHGTYRANTYTHQMLLAFLEEQGQSELTPKVVGLGFLETYHLCLKKRVHASWTTNKCLCRLVRLMHRAVSQGIVRVNPLQGIQYEVVERRPRFLNKAELALILNHAMPEASMELCRQLFVFAAFTGLAMVDILNLKRSQIEQNYKGRLCLRKARLKTQTESFPPPINEII